MSNNVPKSDSVADRGRHVAKNYKMVLSQTAFDPSQDARPIGMVSRGDIRVLVDYILLLEEFVAAVSAKDAERLAKAAQAIV